MGEFVGSLGAAPFTVSPEERLLCLATDLLLAVMDSVSREKVRPQDWWTRARSALETAAGFAEGFSHLISVMCQKLQIDALRRQSSSCLCSIEQQLAGEVDEFLRLLERDAVYIVARAQVRRQEERDARDSVARMGADGALGGNGVAEKKAAKAKKPRVKLVNKPGVGAAVGDGLAGLVGEGCGLIGGRIGIHHTDGGY